MDMTNFKCNKSKDFQDVLEILPDSFSDKRGEIWTSFNKDSFSNFFINLPDFNHDKFSYSKKNVLRGIHGDNKTWKLVSCIHGEIFQVIVDLRKDSKTFKKWKSYEISSKNKKSILIPPNFGNAFLVQSEFAIYHYKLAYEGLYFDAKDQFSLPWNDSSINIDWPVKNPILSERDK